MSELGGPRDAVITVVSGLPRSGTSMMMRMLEAGGLPALADGRRAADQDNPRGYYEYEAVKRLEADASWVDQARGKALKVISVLLRHLPAGYRYKVVFMQRDLREVLASQGAMLARRGKPADPSGEVRMGELFDKHLAEAERTLASRSDIDVLYVRYDAVLREPLRVSRDVDRFLGGQLDVQRMATVVDSELYRQRGGSGTSI